MDFPHYIIVVRENRLADMYGAYLWLTMRTAELLSTPPITQMDRTLLDYIHGKDVLLIGNYYIDHMDSIVSAAKSVTIFYNNAEEIVTAAYRTIVATVPHTGFLTWTIHELSIQQSYILKIAEYLDGYTYGYPSVGALCFYNGLSAMTGLNNLQKFCAITSDEHVRDITISGVSTRAHNLKIAETRFKTAKPISLSVTNRIYTALMAIAESPTVDTCILLASQSRDGIGILFHYDLKEERTFISIRTTQRSNAHAGELLNRLIGGRGYKSFAQGSIDGLIFPHQLLV